MIPEHDFFIRGDGNLSVEEMAKMVGIRSDQFVVDKTEWSYRHMIQSAEHIWSDYGDQVHGSGWQETSRAVYEVRRWEVIDGWRIRFSVNAYPKDVAQAKVWFENGPENSLGVIDSLKTEKYKNFLDEAGKEKQKRTTEEFEKKVTSHELWPFVCAAGIGGLSFGWPYQLSAPEKFIAAFRKGEELKRQNPVKFVYGKKFQLSFDERFRWQGSTGRQHNWVVEPNGESRTPDMRKFDNNGRSRTDGHECWNYILSDELVLVWEKEFTASPHSFRVVHRPKNITPEQKQRALEFEEFAEKEFRSAVGVSGKRSPGIGDGFGL